MFEFFKSIWPGAKPAPSGASLPEGERVYAVGDVHGRRDLFDALIAAIDDDDASAPHAQTTVILLGDLVDRGADSAGVLEAARAWQERRAAYGRKVRILAGNHEEMFLKSFESLDILRHFLRHGGRETLLSFGISREAYNAANIEEVQAMMRRAVPEDVRLFIQGFEDMIAIGDYLFVHAGIEPGTPIAEQKVADLRWIREPFLSHDGSHGVMVVHGHTIAEQPVETSNRIGIDTGAYATGRLTALVLEGSARGYIEAIEGENGEIRIEMR